MNPQPAIDILLPAKERFTAQNAGAISGVVNDLVNASSSSGCFRIVGSAVSAPLGDHKFLGLQPRGRWFRGHNIGCAADYLAKIGAGTPPHLVEVHSRCHVAAYIKAKRPDLRVTLYLHNDPRSMKGGRRVEERKSLLAQMSGITCVSDFIRSCFLDGLDVDDELAAKVGVARNGAFRWLRSQPEKEPLILIAGRMVPEKGILEAAQALATVLPKHPDWRLIIAGARKFETGQRSRYEDAIAATIATLGKQAEMTGFIPIDEVRKWQARSAIAVCPSLWDDPMPKAVLESLAAGCALVTTQRGGIPEVAEGRAYIVETPDVEHFITAFEQLMSDDAFRKSLQDRAWQDFPFTDIEMANSADHLRSLCLTRSHP
jgi:glycosyltransferase involved in cell wall biosynthesis